MYINELAKEYAELLAMLEDPDNDEEVVQDTLEGISGEIEVKLEAYAVIREELIGDASKLKAVIDRLQKRYKSLNANVARLENAIDLGMKTIDKSDLSVGTYRLHYKKNPPHLVLKEDLVMDDVPAQFLKFLPPEINKTDVKNAIKNGESFDWCHLESDVVLKID